MLSPRWMKLLRDARIGRGRIAMMVAAIAAGVFGVTTILAAYTILTREISRNYLDTHPASASLKLKAVDDVLLDTVRRQPGIAAAEARATVDARITSAKHAWLPLTLFIVSDFNAMHISMVRRESGAWPPPPGTLLLEREALALLDAKAGDPFKVRIADGATHDLVVSGVVHDPSLAPAWQEQTVYGYATPETLMILGESGILNTLKVSVKDQPFDIAQVERTVAQLALWLNRQGHVVENIRIPPPGKHPHQAQFTGVLLMLLSFAVMALLLSGILTATMIGGMLAQQVRQIGMMKAVGAGRWQIAGLYFVKVALIGLAATCIALPLGMAAGRGLAGVGAQLLNFTLYSTTVPHWVYLLQLTAGILVPLVIAAIPISNAARITVREALASVGADRKTFGTRRLDGWLAKIHGNDGALVLALRNTFRRRARLLFTLALLALAGGLFVSSLNLKKAWEQALAEAAHARHYDLEIVLNRPESEQRVLAVLGDIPGVQKVEAWVTAPATKSRTDGLAIERTYPDGGHGSLALRTAPPDTALIDWSLLSGRRLRPDDIGGVVLNQGALRFFPDAQAGDFIDLNVDGHSAHLKIAGIARQFMTLPAAYVTPRTYAAIAGSPGQSATFRLALKAHDEKTIAATARLVENMLEKEGIGLKASISETMLGSALDGHVYVLIVNLILVSALMSMVGALGLMSAIGNSVIERTREFGIMRAIGASSGTVLRSVIGEGLLIGLMSCAIALGLSLPLSAALGWFLGTMSFDLPLPLTISLSAVAAWIALVIVGSIAASAYPARNASRLAIRDTLAFL